MAFERDRDIARLRALAARGAWLGTSSWLYEGWRGQVYQGDYSGARKDFVKSRFQAEALTEFSHVFPTGCFDGAYWKFPTYEQLTRYAEQTASDFKLALKATDMITLRRFRDIKEMGPKRGELNSSYLDHRAFNEHFLEPAQKALGDKLGPIIFEFSPFFFGKRFAADSYQPIDFVKDLHKFLDNLPSGVPYGVEVRDAELIGPHFTRYLDCLNYHGVSHVINEQTWMPPIEEQITIPNILTADHVVVRALVRPGVSHEAAVKEFAPYDRTQFPMPAMRTAVAQLIQVSIVDGKTIFVYTNNRVEGNSPGTISGILDLFDEMEGRETTPLG